MKRRIGLIGLALVVLVVLASCAPGPNTMVGEPDTDGDVAGFWMGLWHGIIAPVTFVISLFTDSVSIYDVFNSGGWYDFGFVLGAGIIFGGGGGGAAGSRRRG
jgi:predicted small secreted protein